MTRSEPGRLGPMHRTPDDESSDEDDPPIERWIIDDLDPLRHEEQAIR